MNYFQLEIGFPGPRCNYPDGSDESNAASEAVSKAEGALLKTLKELGIDQRHAYAWTDGSLYKYICTTLSKEEVTKLIRNSLPEDVFLNRVYDTDPSEDPYKCGYKTVKELFGLDQVETAEAGGGLTGVATDLGGGAWESYDE